jgi:hypothetical protein
MLATLNATYAHNKPTLRHRWLYSMLNDLHVLLVSATLSRRSQNIRNGRSLTGTETGLSCSRYRIGNPRSHRGWKGNLRQRKCRVAGIRRTSPKAVGLSRTLAVRTGSSGVR